MSLKKIEIRDFRCLDHVRVEFDARQNLVVGSNAAGKTSLLEAIYTLGSGHSYRTAELQSLIRNEQSEFSIVGTVEDAMRFQSVMAISASKKKRQLRINGSPVSAVSELAYILPVQIIDPDVHRLIEDGPSQRRRFIDWGSFHVEQRFRDIWRKFNRAMNQRNAALKLKLDQFEIWDPEFLDAGSQLTELRESYLASLSPFVVDLGRRILNADISLNYQRGWNQSQSLAEALRHARERDQQRGSTTVGPQRAELTVKLDNDIVKGRVSRGQQKLISCILVLAQQLHRAATGSKQGCLLLDDPAAELDVNNLGKLFEIISALPVQLIVTALSPVGLTFLDNPKMFHVERGTLTSVA